MSAHVLSRLIDSSGTHDQISNPGLSLRNCTTGSTSAHLLINRCGQMFCDLETHCWDPCISERSAHRFPLQTSLNRATCGTRTGCLLCVIKIIRLKDQSDLTPGFEKNYNNGVIVTDSTLRAIYCSSLHQSIVNDWPQCIKTESITIIMQVLVEFA